LVKTDISFSVDNNGINNKITFEFPENIVAEPLLDHNDEYIYVYNSNLYKIKTENLEQQWKYPLSNIVKYRGIIDNNDEYLYIGDIDGNIYKFNIKNNSLENEYKLKEEYKEYNISTNFVLNYDNTYLFFGISYNDTEKINNIFVKLDINLFIDNNFNEEISDGDIDKYIILLDNYIYLSISSVFYKIDISNLSIKDEILDVSGKFTSFIILNDFIYLFIKRDTESKFLIINIKSFKDYEYIQSDDFNDNDIYIIDNIRNNILYVHNSTKIKLINLETYNTIIFNTNNYTNINGNIVKFTILDRYNNIYVTFDTGIQIIIKDDKLISFLNNYDSISNNLYNRKYINKVVLNDYVNRINILGINNISEDLSQYEYLNPGYIENDGLIILEMYLNYDIIKNNKKMVIKNDILTKNLVVLDKKININQNDILININEILEREDKYIPTEHIHSLNYTNENEKIFLSEYIESDIIYQYYEINSDSQIELINFNCDILMVGGGGGRGESEINGAGGGGEVIIINNILLNGIYDIIVGNEGLINENGSDSIIKNNNSILFKAFGGGKGGSVYTYFPNNIKINVSTTSDTVVNFTNFTNDEFIASRGNDGSLTSYESDGNTYYNIEYVKGNNNTINMSSGNNVEHINNKGQNIIIGNYETSGNNIYTSSSVVSPNHYNSITNPPSFSTYGYGKGYYHDRNYQSSNNNGVVFYRENNTSQWYVISGNTSRNINNNVHTFELYLIGSGGNDVENSSSITMSFPFVGYITTNYYYNSAGSSGGVIYIKYEAKYYGKDNGSSGGSGGGITGRSNYIYNYNIPQISNGLNTKGNSYDNIDTFISYMNDGGKNLDNLRGGAGGGALSSGKDNGEGGDGYEYKYYKTIKVGTGGYSHNFLEDITDYYGKGSDTNNDNATKGIIILVSKKDEIESNVVPILSEGTHIENSFTGKHFVSIQNEEFHQGYIVSTTGKYQDIDSSYHPDSINRNIDISQALPIVEYSKKEKDKKCFGVVNYIEKKDDKFRDNGYNFFYNSIKRDGDERLIVNSIGEGSIWVSNYNGPLENGDFITTSPIPGIGMKQDEDYITNYTVGKITMDCDFNPKKIEVKRSLELYRNGILNNTLDKNENIIYENTGIIEDEYKIENIDINGNIREDGEYIMAFVGCTYHCG
jgi:hypothetical protein